ncbi:MAG TPA: hypothetical protein VEI97_10505 [bacterium]|nr:hypothetical protein [bacterium]
MADHQGNLFEMGTPDMRPTVPYQPHSETSRAAAESVQGNVATWRALVLQYIQSMDERGCTDEEGSEALGLGPSTYRPRRCELVEAGQVRDSGKTRLGKSGRKMTVWIATQ